MTRILCTLEFTSPRLPNTVGDLEGERTDTDDYERGFQSISHLTVTAEQNSRERTRNLTQKASFLAISAGVLVSALIARSWHISHWSLVLPLVFATLALLLASYAMKPETLLDINTAPLLSDLEGGKSSKEIDVE